MCRHWHAFVIFICLVYKDSKHLQVDHRWFPLRPFILTFKFTKYRKLLKYSLYDPHVIKEWYSNTIGDHDNTVFSRRSTISKIEHIFKKSIYSSPVTKVYQSLTHLLEDSKQSVKKTFYVFFIWSFTLYHYSIENEIKSSWLILSSKPLLKKHLMAKNTTISYCPDIYKVAS